jgi:hypothetical protein
MVMLAFLACCASITQISGPIPAGSPDVIAMRFNRLVGLDGLKAMFK